MMVKTGFSLALVLALTLTFMRTNGQQTLPLLPPICLIPTNSPQFGLLCRLGDPDLPLNASILDTQDLSQLVDFTPNQICDLDCRCAMGATVRGGRCGRRSSDQKTFCICDYNTDPPRPPSYSTLQPEVISLCTASFGLALDLCGNPTTNQLQGGVPHQLCNSDCMCSHGYPSGVNYCYLNSTMTGNSQPYCFCGNATNIASPAIL